MKTIFNILLVVCGCCGYVFSAETPPKTGFIRLVQAVAPGTGSVNVRIDGEDLFPQGYDLGQCSGGMGFEVGEHRIEIVKPGVLRTTVKISLAEGETVTLVAYAERRDPPAGAESRTKWKMMVLHLRQPPPAPGFHLTMVSVSSREEIPVKTMMAGKRNPAVSLVRRIDPVGVPLGRSGGDMLDLQSGEMILGHVSLDEKGEYVVILYDKEDGGLGMVSFYDPKHMIAG